MKRSEKKLISDVLKFIRDILQLINIEVGTDYIILTGGVLIQWGTKTVKTTTSGGTMGYYGNASVTFTKKFNAAPLVFTNIRRNPSYWNSASYNNSATSTTLYAAGNNKNSDSAIDWLAIGFMGGGTT